MDPASLFGNLFFGLVGYAAYRYGKARERPLKMVIGVVLCVFPWLVPDGPGWLGGSAGCSPSGSFCRSDQGTPGSTGISWMPARAKVTCSHCPRLAEPLAAVSSATLRRTPSQ